MWVHITKIAAYLMVKLLLYVIMIKRTNNKSSRSCLIPPITPFLSHCSTAEQENETCVQSLAWQP